LLIWLVYRASVSCDRTINGVRLSIGMMQMFTSDVTFLAQGFSAPPHYAALLDDEGIGRVEGRPDF